MFDDIRNREVVFYPFHSIAAKDLIAKFLMKDPDERLSDPEEIM